MLRRQQRRQSRRRTGGLRPRRAPRRPRQRGSGRGCGFHPARHRAAQRRGVPLQLLGGKGGRIVKRGAMMLTVFAVCVLSTLVPLGQRGASPPRWPGRQKDGTTLLPNGWRIAPAGRHVQVGDLPMNMAPSPDGRFIVISSSGWETPALIVFDTRTLQVISRTPMEHTWLGLVWHPSGTRLFASGSSENKIHEFAWNAGTLTPKRVITLGPAE